MNKYVEQAIQAGVYATVDAVWQTVKEARDERKRRKEEEKRRKDNENQDAASPKKQDDEYRQLEFNPKD